VRDATEDARAVSRVLLAPACAAVRHAHEHLQRLRDVQARGRFVQLPHEAHAAGVAIVLGIEEALRAHGHEVKEVRRVGDGCCSGL